jgi:hypothetical protein
VGTAAGIRRSEGGQASVELVAALPALLLVSIFVWQCALAGHTAWMAAHAARAAARAEAVGGDARAAARSALPNGLERGLEVEPGPDGAVRVRVRVPLLTHRWLLPASVGAASSLGGKG